MAEPRVPRLELPFFVADGTGVCPTLLACLWREGGSYRPTLPPYKATTPSPFSSDFAAWVQPGDAAPLHTHLPAVTPKPGAQVRVPVSDAKLEW